MISIGKLTNAHAAVEYLNHSIADNLLDYYAGTGERPGIWDGPAAAFLGLTGEVTPDDLRSVLDGRNPRTGADLGRRHTNHRNVAYDMTVSAPKSMSILYALGDADVRSAVLDAHEAGVDAAIAFMQSHAAWARRANDGKMVAVKGEIIAPRFRHRTARPVTDHTTGEVTIDPQLHTHVPICSWVRGVDDGIWSALYSEHLYRHAAAAGAVAQAAMRHVLVERLGVRPIVDKNGTFELAGITDAQRRASSKRRQQIEESGDEMGHGSLHSRGAATLATREEKHEVGVSRELWNTWRDRGAQIHITEESINAMRGTVRADSPQPTPEFIEAITGYRGLTQSHATFRRRDVIRRVAASLTNGATPDTIEQLTDAVLSNPETIRLANTTQNHDPGHARIPDPIYSTREMVELERGMLHTAILAKNRAPKTQLGLVTKAIAARPFLTADQKGLINAVCSSGDGVVTVEGVAGSGKTVALEACREALEADGRTVIGMALAGRAARTLEEESGIPSSTIAAALNEYASADMPPNTVVVVDEAGMVGSRDLAILVDICRANEATLVLCGDSRQLQPIEAGAPFRALGDHLGRTELTTNLRQHELWEREALAMVRAGKIHQAVGQYLEHEAVDVAPTVMERRQRVVAASLAAMEAGQTTVVLTRSRDDAAAINELTRAVRSLRGELSGATLQAGAIDVAEGDRIVCLKNQGRGEDRITNGLIGEVVAVDVGARTLTLNARGREVAIDVTHYPHVAHAYALTAHKAQGVTADVALVVGSEAASREWAYSALSRGRQHTRYFTVDHAVDRDLDGASHATPAPLTVDHRLAVAWGRSEGKDSTLDHRMA